MATTITYDDGMWRPNEGMPTATAAVPTTAPLLVLPIATTQAAVSIILDPTTHSIEETTVPLPLAAAATTTTPSSIALPSTTSLPLASTSSVPSSSSSKATVASTTINYSRTAASGTAVPTLSAAVESSLSNSTAAHTPVQDDSATQFHAYYLTPLFVFFPIILGILVWWKFGRKRKDTAIGGKKDYGGNGLWSTWDSRRNGREGGAGGIPADERGLVRSASEGKWIGQLIDDDRYNEKANGNDYTSTMRPLAPTKKQWFINLFKKNPLTSSASYDSRSPRFYYNSPFEAPTKEVEDETRYQREVDEFNDPDRRDRGWAWGTKEGMSPRVVRQHREGGSDECAMLDSRGKGLTSGWRMATKKYRAKAGANSVTSSISSLTSRRGNRGGMAVENGMMGRYDQLSEGRDDRFAQHQEQSSSSPSMYSPSVQDYHQQQQQHLDSDQLNDYLGESRVGHDGLARRYLTGQLTPAEQALSNQHQHQHPSICSSSLQYSDNPYQDPSAPAAFEIPSHQLPSQPSTIHISPTKSALVRPMPPPMPTSPLPSTPATPHSPAYTSLSDVLGSYSAGNGAMPYDQQHSKSKRMTVGSPMPAYESGNVRASDSTLSLSGVRGLMFGDDDDEGMDADQEEEERQDARRREAAKARRRSSVVPVPAAEHKQHRSSAAPTPSSTSASAPPTSSVSNQQQHQSHPSSSSQQQDRSNTNTTKPLIPSRVRLAIAQVEARSSPPASPVLGAPSSNRAMMNDVFASYGAGAEDQVDRSAHHHQSSSSSSAPSTSSSQASSANGARRAKKTSSGSVSMMRAVTEEDVQYEQQRPSSEKRRSTILSSSNTSYRRPMSGAFDDAPDAAALGAMTMMTGAEVLSPRSAKKMAAPLSSDHKRLATLLRRSTDGLEGTGRRGSGSGGGGGIEGMMRRSEGV